MNWPQALQSRLQAGSNDRPARVVIAGVGNDLRGDDRAGLAVVRDLRRELGAGLPETWLLVEAQNAPESHTGPMRRFGPDLVLFVDVAWLDIPPGEIQLIPWQDTTGMSASTHTFPLHLLASYLNRELDCDVMLLGIRPRDLDLSEQMSPPVQDAVGEIVNALRNLAVAA